MSTTSELLRDLNINPFATVTKVQSLSGLRMLSKKFTIFPDWAYR